MNSVSPTNLEGRMDLRIEHRTLQRQAVDKLRGAILAGIFKPGDRLVEAKLCTMLGISRASVREALRGLEAERLIDIIPNRGPQIPIVTWEQAEQIYEVRSLLEGRAAALCAKYAGPADLRQLEQAIEAFREASEADDLARCLQATSDFYRIILRCSRNTVIEQILSGLHARVSFLRSRSMAFKGRAKISLREMRAILLAIKAGDARGAQKAAELHVDQARLSAKRHYEESVPVRLLRSSRTAR